MAEVRYPATIQVGDTEVRVATVVVEPGVSATIEADITGLTQARALTVEEEPLPS
jgi:hypothetical protein